MIAVKGQPKITRTLCPSNYSLSFDLWRTKSRTSSQDITMFHTPKERSDLVQHLCLRIFSKFGQNKGL